MDPTKIDLVSPDAFAAGVPHDAFRHLRNEAPVSWRVPPTGEAGYWTLTRHRDVQQAALDAATYSSWLGGTNLRDEPPDRLAVSRFILLNIDPPQHTRHRRLVTRAFAVRAVEKLLPRVAEMSRAILDRVAERGECDFVRDVATELPTQVIFELLGVPESDRARLTELSNTMMGAEDPDYGGRGPETALPAAMEMYGYAFQMATARRAEPRDDLVSALVQAEVDGEKLTDPDINAFFLLLVVAGNETTRNLLSGGLLALLEHPAEMARLRADRSLLPSAVEEMLRYVSPVMMFRRTVARDHEIHGQTLRTGEKLLLAYCSANHDERAFPEPERFDITRSPNPHIAFGYGPHLCIGASLARLEAGILIAEVLDRMSDIELAGPVTRLRSSLVNSYKSLPIRFTPARRS